MTDHAIAMTNLQLKPQMQWYRRLSRDPKRHGSVSHSPHQQRISSQRLTTISRMYNDSRIKQDLDSVAVIICLSIYPPHSVQG